MPLNVTFESGTYSTGNLAGQDSWSNDQGDATDSSVQTTTKYLGSQAVRCQNTDLHKCSKAFASAATTDSQFFFIRMDTLGTSGDGAGYWFDSAGTNLGRIGFGTTDLEIYNGSSWTSILDSYSTATWYEVEFAWDGTRNSGNGQIRARAREAGGTWGSYSSWSNGENNFSSCDGIIMRPLSVNGDMYFDDLSETEESSTSIKSVAGVTQANIKSIAGVTEANLKSIAGVANS